MSRRPWLAPLVVGAFLRLVAALAGYGYFASDDYTHVLGMAATWLDDPAAPFNSDIRSPLLAWIVWGCFTVARWLFGSDPIAHVHVAYVVLGAFNAGAIPAVYVLTERRFGPRAALSAAWLMSAEALMPRIATRALISVVAMVPLAWGTVFADRESATRLRDGVFAGLLLGIAAMFRFQVGLVCVTVAALLAWKDRPRLAGLALGGAGAAFLQLGIDRFASVLGYLGFNAVAGGSERYGTSPWFTYVLDFVVLTLPPLTFWLAKPLWRSAKGHLLVSVPFAVFVIAHSFVGHKEEHFIFAVLPYFFVLLGAALVAVPRRARIAYWVVNCVVLAVVTLSDGHRSLTRPIVEAGRDGGFGRLYFFGRLLTPDMYAGKELELRHVYSTGELVEQLSGETALRVRIVFERSPEPETLQALDRTGFGCSAPEVSRGDLVDRILVAVNPANRRRGEKTVVDCLR